MRKYKLKMKVFNTKLKILVNKEAQEKEIVREIRGLVELIEKGLDSSSSLSEITYLNLHKEVVPSKHLKNLLLQLEKYNTNDTLDSSIGLKDNFNLRYEINKFYLEGEINIDMYVKGYLLNQLKELLDNKNCEYEIFYGDVQMYETDQMIKLKNDVENENNEINLCLENGKSICTNIINSSSVSVININPILADLFAKAIIKMDMKNAIDYIKVNKLEVVYLCKETLYVTRNLIFEKPLGIEVQYI